MERTPFDQEFDRLNPDQRKAVCHTGGSLLVLAGAGSGKTRVATMRIAHLIREGVSPQTIVAVTFTNKAAREMRERVHRLVGSDVLVSTFHSLGARILRESIDRLGYPAAFVIYAEEESEKVLKGCLKGRGLQCKDAEVSTYRSAISKVKNEPSLFEKFDVLTRSLFEQYQAQLRQSGAVDFDDLIYLPIELFRHHPDILERYCRRWKYLLVDEYQDTSDNQCQFASFLAGPSQNIFAVGDPDQSIYSWRGAKISNILSFQRQFSNATIVRLEQNYRSTNTILEASNAVIGHNEARYEKSLWSQRGRGEPIVRYMAPTERREAEFVVNRIEELIEAGSTYDQIAVLYRTNAQSRSLEDKFIESRLPYRIWGGIPFYSRKEIKDILSILQVASSPRDAIAFERALRLVSRGIGDVTLTKLLKAANQEQRPICDIAFDAANGGYEVSKKQQEGFAKFCTLISSLREALEGGTAFGLLSDAVDGSGYVQLLEKDSETILERKENIAQLLGRANEWDESHAGVSPLLFIEELVLEGAREYGKDDGPCTTLATVHNAKGLEFPIVFIVGLEEDLFPHMSAKRSEDGVEEERRLFYVGMTRAKDRLFLCAAQARFLFGGLRSMRPSCFLKEVPSQCVVPYAGFVRKVPVIEPEEPRPQAELFSVGQIVLHPHFGIGRIEKVSTTSLGPAYEVLFSNDQTKRKIMAAYSPMRVVR
jgi:DNA helicase II / ATP-dependent DNA helicase PcrA